MKERKWNGERETQWSEERKTQGRERESIAALDLVENPRKILG